MLDIDYDTLRDDDGYPTDAAIAHIENFRGTPEHLTTLIIELWHLLDVTPEIDPETGDVKVVLVTAGWSGNETIISALKNTSYHMFGWQSSSRGGLHVYEFKANAWTSDFVFPLPQHRHQCPNSRHVFTD